MATEWSFVARGLPNAGVDLVAPSASEYSSLLTGIERRLNAFEALPFGEKDPTAAILLNRSDKAIAAWSLIWLYEEWKGRRYTSSIVSGCGTIPSLLLPFGMTKAARAISGYWHVILPGSKRYVSGGRTLGDNADVRPPTPEEDWNGGVFSVGGSWHNGPMDAIRRVTLILDGVFFSDGEFAGPNDAQLYELIVCDAEVYQAVSTLARSQFEAGIAARDILAAVEQVTGAAQHWPPPPPPPGRKMDIEEFHLQACASLAWRIATLRQTDGDEKAVSILVSWADTVLPRYRRV